MAYGYRGRVLRVDLSGGGISVDAPDGEFYRKYFGGGALATHYLLSEMAGGVDPFGPDNVLVMAPSVLVGAPISGYVRYTVAAKSPLTQAFGESEAGGFWGPELKFAGFDAIVVRGIAPEPVYLWVHDGEAEIRPAKHLWGKYAGDVEDEIRRELGDTRIRVLQAGPAGERLVRFAGVGNNLRHYNGRCGMGAVMGAKGLRAVAVRGHDRLPMHDEQKVREIARWFPQQGPSVYTELGTAYMVLVNQKSGILPTRNFREGVFEAAEAISGERLKATICPENEGCWACSVRCKRRVKAGAPYNITDRYGGPEYETIGAFGSLCGISDMEAIARANELCNMYVMDTISTGVTVAFAMDCFENGILSQSDADGLDLRFGNATAMLKLVESIGERQGLGDLLAEGVKRAAAEIGRGAEDLAIHIKGQEVPLHDPRGKLGLALSYAVSPTGADHIEAPHDPIIRAEGPAMERMRAVGLLSPVDPLALDANKVRAFVLGQSIWSTYNSIGVCNFVGFPGFPFTAHKIAEVVNAVTGWETSFHEIIKVGERAINMARLFNLREGLTDKDDTLPERLFQPLPDGPLAGRSVPREQFKEALQLYYELMGWDRNSGVPSRGKLIELGLEWAAPD